MVIDFSKLKDTGASDKVLEPRKIFTSLPEKDKRYNYPRDVQTQVMEKWFDRRNERDLVVKMNTGAGKTVVALLMLKSSLNEGAGPAVYVAPDKYLVQQVLEEAKRLGVAVVESENDPKYLSGKAILVINIVKLFNGKSAFGIGAEGEKIKIGTILIDDAHSCISIAREKFTLRLPASHAAFDSLFKLFREEMGRQSPPTVLDIEVNDPNAILQVPFWSWKDKRNEVLKVLHAYRETDTFRFIWPLINEILPHCVCVFSGSSLEITPRCLPSDIICSFAGARRRIYMTATLADDSVLITDFMADPQSIATAITPNSGDDLGDRMILAPQELNPSLSENEIKALLKAESAKYNVVVIAPSNKRADFWADVADQTLAAENLLDGLAKLRTRRVGITVLVNRYDGIDLPGDACRILVIDGLPEVQGLLERIDQSALEGSDGNIRRQIQRIEQGMGRGVRSNEDFCVVMLLGARLTKRIHNPTGYECFTPATRAQLDLSRQIAEQLQGKSLAELKQAMDLCLNRNHDWVSASKGALVTVKPTTNSTINPMAGNIRKAFDLARLNQYNDAAMLIQKAINATDPPKLKGWLKQQMAEYVHHVSATEAQKLLLSAAVENRRVLRPIQGVTYNRLSASAVDQANTAVLFFREHIAGPTELVVEMNSLLEDLVFQPETAEKFEAAIKQAGRMIGFPTQRPEKQIGKGPDGLWSLGDLRYLIIECKNGAVTAKINKHDCDQLSGAMNWFRDTYDGSCKPVPVMIHPSDTSDTSAAPYAEMRVINTERLKRLKEALRAFTTAMTPSGVMNDPKRVGEALNSLHLTAGEFVDYFTVAVKRSR